MTNHESETLILTLSPSELARAARLGGLPITLDEQPFDDPEISIELIHFFARRGIAVAIHDSFERVYQLRYPDDIEASYWQEKITW